MTLRLSRVKRLCLVSSIQTRRVQPEFKRKLREKAGFSLPTVSVTPYTFWVLLLWQKKLLVWQLLGCRYAGETYFFLPTFFLFETCVLYRMVCHLQKNIKRNLWLSEPQRNPFTSHSASLIWNVRNCIAIHLANENPMWYSFKQKI